MKIFLLAAGAIAVLVCLIVLAAVFVGTNWVAWAVGALILVAVIAFVLWFRETNPDEDRDDNLMPLGLRRFLICYLLAVSALLIAAIAVLFSFNFLHDGHGKPLNAAEGFIPKPAQYGYLDIRLWRHHQRWWLSLDMQFLLLGVFAGALGSSIHAVKSLADFLGNRTAKTSWFWFYITRPCLGAALAMIFYAVIRGGLMTGAQGEAAGINPFGVVALCGLAGLFADRATQKLGEVFDTLFKTDDTRKDKLAAAQPDRLDPPTVTVGGAVRDVTVRGTGLGGTNKVRINGTDRTPKSVSDTAVTFTLTGVEVAARGRLTIQLVTTGGDLSKELILNISDIAITTAALASGTVGQPYGPVQLQATGGTGAGTYRWTAQGLPGGITPDQDTGRLSGTPAAGTVGPHPVEITVTDRDGTTAKIALNLTIA